MDLQEAKTRFDRAMGYCDDIVEVHRGHGGGQRGLRTLETSLNRAIVVLAVAAWQTVVQDLITAALDHLHPAGGGGVGNLLRGQALKAVSDFSTPDAEKSRNLLKLVDFDPYPLWTWTQAGGRGVGMVVITPSDAAAATNDWLRLRHDIAHGHPYLTAVEVLEHVRQAIARWQVSHPVASHRDALNHFRSLPGFQPSLRLKDATSCMKHFRRLARLTARGLANTGVPPANIW